MRIGGVLFNYSTYEIMWIFVIYAFLGWLFEVAFAASKNKGKFINRGFLNGPFCPIYGFSILTVVVLLTPLKSNLLLLFVGAILLTTFFEFVTGYVLEKAFHQKWWDYTECSMNIRGYICVWISAFWGFACTLIIYLVQPLVDDVIQYLSNNTGNMAIVLIIAILIVDAIMTVISLLKVKKKIRSLEDIMVRIDELNRNILDSVATARKTHDKRMQELDDLRKKYQSILREKIIGYNRIAKAFPQLDFSEINKRLKNKSK